jgi:WD40 repeat protein
MKSFIVCIWRLWLTNSRKLIATCGNDYTTKVWYIPLESVEDEISLSRTKPCFKLRVQCVKFERSFLHSVVFAKKDASIVAASCANGMIRLFNTTDGSVMLTINLSGVTRLAISSKYEFLALATNSGRCSVFTLHYDD